MNTLRRPLLVLALFAVAAASGAPAQELPRPADLPKQDGLPDPLAFFDGRKVQSKEQWVNHRRPELQRLFQHYMYGNLPPKPAEIAVIATEPRDCLGGKATWRQFTIAFVKPQLKRKLNVLFIAPKEPQSPPAVFVGMNFCGNHAVLDDPAIEIPSSWVYKSCAGAENERATEKGRGSQREVWNADLIVERGYALATFYSGDIDPDTADFSDGLNGELLDLSKPLPGDAAGTIACWAWGYHRVVDALTRPIDGDRLLIDPRRIIAVGHSRNGKTSLLAAALDERIALAIPHQAGCGGTAPSRTTDSRAESVQRINTSFPHWFCENFVQFNEATDRLPFDQHCLVALCAPRPVLYSNAQEDQWANPSGQFAMLKAASPVYELLGVEGLAAESEPRQNELVASRLGYFIRPGKHSMTRADWQVFLDFADKHLAAR